MSQDYESFTPFWHTRPENPADSLHHPAVVPPADLERFNNQPATSHLVGIEAVELADGNIAYVGITPEYQKHRQQSARKEITVLEQRLAITERMLTNTEAALADGTARLDKLLAAAEEADEADRRIIRQTAGQRQWLINELTVRRDNLAEDRELVSRRLESAKAKRQQYG